MVERPFELPFESLIKEARSISVYDGNNEKTALQPWLVEVNDIILLTNPGPQRAYIFNIIMSKIQGPARQVIQRIINPNWESMRAALIANFGVTEPYTALVNEIHRVSFNPNIDIVYDKLSKLLNKLNTKYTLEDNPNQNSEFNPARNEKLVLHRFKGCISEYKAYLIESRNCASLNEAYNLLKSIEMCNPQSYERKRNNNRNQSNNYNPSYQRPSYNRNNYNHNNSSTQNQNYNQRRLNFPQFRHFHQGFGVSSSTQNRLNQNQNNNFRFEQENQNRAEPMEVEQNFLMEASEIHYL